MSDGSEDPVEAFRLLLIIRFLEVGVITILGLDWVDSFAEEVEFIWSPRWTLTTLLYIGSRYSAFIDVPLRVVDYVSPTITPMECLRTQYVATWTHGIGTILAELILMTRTYAIYDRSKIVLISLLILLAACIAGSSWSTDVFLKSNHFTEPHLPVGGCHLENANNIAFLSILLILLFEFVIVALTTWKAWKYFRGRGSRRYRISHVLYRDGLLFFLGMFACSISIVIAMVAAPLDFVGLFTTLTRVVHSILCCRVLLHLRRAASDRHRRYTSTDDMLLTPVSADALGWPSQPGRATSLQLGADRVPHGLEAELKDVVLDIRPLPVQPLAAGPESFGDGRGRGEP